MIVGLNNVCIQPWCYSYVLYLEFQSHIPGEPLQSPEKPECPGRSRHGSHMLAQSMLTLD